MYRKCARQGARRNTVTDGCCGESTIGCTSVSAQVAGHRELCFDRMVQYEVYTFVAGRFKKGRVQLGALHIQGYRRLDSHRPLRMIKLKKGDVVLLYVRIYLCV